MFFFFSPLMECGLISSERPTLPQIHALIPQSSHDGSALQAPGVQTGLLLWSASDSMESNNLLISTADSCELMLWTLALALCHQLFLLCIRVRHSCLLVQRHHYPSQNLNPELFDYEGAKSFWSANRKATCIAKLWATTQTLGQSTKHRGLSWGITCTSKSTWTLSDPELRMKSSIIIAWQVLLAWGTAWLLVLTHFRCWSSFQHN